MDNLIEACHELLGIAPSQQPADYYQLLGLARYESEPVVIENAADCRMAFVRQLAAGPYQKISQELLNLLAEARVCLTNRATREQYNRGLEQEAPGLTDEPVARGASSSGTSVRSDPSEGRPAQPTIRDGPWSLCAAGPVATLAADPCSESDDAPTWIIGAGRECDIVINSPYVSRRHCRLTQLGERFLLEDLDSRNGTFVNGHWLSKAAVVSSGDTICLGAATELSWSRLLHAMEGDAATPAFLIGRGLDNDLVIPDPTVSHRHAELREAGAGVLLVDLGSTNGTHVGEPPQRVARVVLSPGDVLRFGSFCIPAATLLRRFE